MNIKLVRKLDFYLGIPLCWILSFSRRIRELKNKAFRKSRIYPEKVLFIELCEMGSIILSYPAMIKLKKIYPDVDIYFLTFAQNREAVLGSGVIGEGNIIEVKNGSTLIIFLSLWQSIRKLRRIGVNTVVDMNLFFRVSTILSYLSGASTRVGFYQKAEQGLYRGDMQTHNVLYNPHKHMKDNFISLVNALTPDEIVPYPGSTKYSDIKNISEVVHINHSDIKIMRDRLNVLIPGLREEDKIVLVNLGENDVIGLRTWPRENYNELISSLLKHKSLFVIMVGKGHPENRDLISHARCLDLIDKTSVKEIISLCKLANAMVSHDCGMIHLASLTDIFICALFGPETPKLYAPITENMRIFYKELSCSPCLSAYNHKSSNCKNNKCMRTITVDEVYNYVIKWIK